jgi:hypothetical protein
MKWKDPTPKPPMNHNNPWQLQQISDFYGGLYTSSTANQLKENQFTELLNFRYNPDGTLRTRCGKTPAVGLQDTDRISQATGGSETHPSSPGGTYSIIAIQRASRGRYAFEFSDDISAKLEIGKAFTIAGANTGDSELDALINTEHVASDITHSGTRVEPVGSKVLSEVPAGGGEFTNATWSIEGAPTEAKTFFAEEVEGEQKFLMAMENVSTTAVELRYEDGSDWSTVLHTFTTGTRPLFQKYAQGSAEEVIIANGVDAPQRWNKDDTTTSPLGLTGMTPNIAIVSITQNSATPSIVVTGDYADFFFDTQTITVSGAVHTDYNKDYVINGVPSFAAGVTTIVSSTASPNQTLSTPGVLNPRAPTVTFDVAKAGGSGVTLNGTYNYKFTYFYNESGTTKYGESNGGGAASTVEGTTLSATLTGRNIDITNIEFPAQVEAVNIYRSRPNRTDVYYYVGRVTSGSTFTDTTPTGAEGLPLPVDDGSVPNIKYPINVDGRIVAVDGDIENKLVWTPRGTCDQFLALDYIYLRDKITGIAPFGGSVYIFTLKEIYVVPDSNFAAGIAVKVCNKGTVSHRSIADVGSGLVWLGDDNVYWANFNIQDAEGDFPIAVGRPIQDQIRRQSYSRRENACATFFERHYYLCFTTSGRTENDITLAMNTDIMMQALRENGAGWVAHEWRARDIHQWREKMYTLELNNYLVLSGDEGPPPSYTPTFFIYEYNEDLYYDYTSQTNLDAGTVTEIDVTLRSGEWHFGSAITNKLIRGMTVSFYGDNASYNVILDANNTEYTKSMVLESTAELKEGDPTFLYWDAEAASAGAWQGSPVAAWQDVTSITSAGAGLAEITVTQDVSGLIDGDEIWVSDVSEDYRFNRKFTVASTSGTSPTLVTVDESTDGFADATSTTAKVFVQHGIETSDEFTWATGQRGNNTVRRKCPTMKCTRFIFELNGKAHRDARLAAVGVAYKLLPTAF